MFWESSWMYTHPSCSGMLCTPYSAWVLRFWLSFALVCHRGEDLPLMNRWDQKTHTFTLKLITYFHADYVPYKSIYSELKLLFLILPSLHTQKKLSHTTKPHTWANTFEMSMSVSRTIFQLKSLIQNCWMIGKIFLEVTWMCSLCAPTLTLTVFYSTFFYTECDGLISLLDEPVDDNHTLIEKRTTMMRWASELNDFIPFIIKPQWRSPTTGTMGIHWPVGVRTTA